MHFVCWAFAAGSLLVSYGAKKIFDDQKVYEKIFSLKINENNEEHEGNGIFNFTQKIKNKMTRQETKNEGNLGELEF